MIVSLSLIHSSLTEESEKEMILIVMLVEQRLAGIKVSKKIIRVCVPGAIELKRLARFARIVTREYNDTGII